MTHLKTCCNLLGPPKESGLPLPGGKPRGHSGNALASDGRRRLWRRDHLRGYMFERPGEATREQRERQDRDCADHVHMVRTGPLFQARPGGHGTGGDHRACVWDHLRRHWPHFHADVRACGLRSAGVSFDLLGPGVKSRALAVPLNHQGKRFHDMRLFYRSWNRLESLKETLLLTKLTSNQKHPQESRIETRSSVCRTPAAHVQLYLQS